MAQVEVVIIGRTKVQSLLGGTSKKVYFQDADDRTRFIVCKQSTF